MTQNVNTHILGEFNRSARKFGLKYCSRFSCNYTFSCVMKREIEQIEHINITSIWWLSECRNGINNNRTQWSETFTRALLQRFLYAREKSDPCCAYLFKLFSQLQYIYTIKSLVEKIATAWKNKDTRELWSIN